MFYLLKNNKIIDTNDKTFKEKYIAVNGITHYSIETPNETHHHYCLGGGEYEDNIYEFHSTSIKRQSENVFELIEVGDLVRYKTKCLGIEYLYTMEIIEKAFEDYAKRGFYNVLAIYKPDANDNYIKVWEKKKDETI